MTYRSLLVYLDDDPLCAARAQVAVRLARTFDCRLTGVAPTGLVDVPMAIGADPSVGRYAAMATDLLRDQAEQVVRRFRDQCDAAGLTSFETAIDECEPAHSLVNHSRCSDLTLLTQADPRAASHRATRSLIEEVVLNSARPTLILPYAGKVDSLGTSVLVAWDDSRESARAIGDALAFLQRAKQVHVLAWNEGDALEADRLADRLDALCRWLRWHDVAADARVETSTIGIADAILSRAADLGADLIVMGAYGHARWTERVLGGATHGLLDAMTVPVLMSH